MSVPDYMAQPADRPVGISILSVLHFIGGVGLLIAAVVFAVVLQRDAKIAATISEIGIPAPLLIAAIVFLALLSVASSVGMWKGTRWGWYLGSFYYAYSIARHVSALLNVDDLFHSFPQEPGNMSHGISYYYTKYGMRLVISALIYLYFFKDNVREYFGLRESKKWIAVAIQLFLCIDVALLVTAWFKYSR